MKCKPFSLTGSLAKTSHDLLSMRDSLGLQFKQVFILERTWSGLSVGEGEASDCVKQVLPTPYIVNLSQNVDVLEGGAVKQGDIILKSISKTSYPNRSQLDAVTGALNKQRFFIIGDEIFEVINIKESYFTWDVQVRKTYDQTRYE